MLVGTDDGVADDEGTMLLRKSIPGLVRTQSGRYHLKLEVGYGVDVGVVKIVKGVLHKSVSTITCLHGSRTWLT